MSFRVLISILNILLRRLIVAISHVFTAMCVDFATPFMIGTASNIDIVVIIIVSTSFIATRLVDVYFSRRLFRKVVV